MDDEKPWGQRLALVAAVAQVLHNGLAVLGVGTARRCEHETQARQHPVGVIIGIVLGLAAALAVAVTLIKVPVPHEQGAQPFRGGQDAAGVAQEPELGPQRAPVRQEPGESPAARPPA